MASAKEAHNAVSPALCNICGSTHLAQYRMRSDGVSVLRCVNCGMGVVEERPADLASLYDDAYYASVNGPEHGYADYSYTAEHGVAWAARLFFGCRS